MLLCMGIGGTARVGRLDHHIGTMGCSVLSEICNFVHDATLSKRCCIVSATFYWAIHIGNYTFGSTIDRYFSACVLL